jgi:hypothetical protein
VLDGQPRTNESVQRLVKSEERDGETIARAFAVASQQMCFDRHGANPPALESQEYDFADRVELPQMIREFEAVDDLRVS